MVGKVLGKRYQIVERIGGGGMALVYRAADIQLGRDVAVKILRGQFGGDEDFVRRFRREAQSAASLSHPNVVQIFDVGHDDEQYFIVMELVEGQTLKEIIQQQGPLPVAEAGRIAMEILGALSHAHQHRIVHRDIKPHNILIAKDGRVKVTDFGIARATTTDTVTHTGSIMGSAHYFSPEQANGQPTGDRSDIYSIGIVLYEMVTGAVPFQGESPITVALKHIREQPLPPSRLNGEVPQELDELILRALEKEPEDRFPSADVMKQAVMEFLMAHAAGKTHVASGDFPTMDLSSMRTAGAPVEEELAHTAAARRRNRESDRKRKRGIPGWVWMLLVAAIVLGALGAGAMAVMKFLDVPVVKVPDVTGMAVTEATTKLAESKLGFIIAATTHSDLPANYVVQSRPEPETEVKQGREIHLVISKGPETVTLDDVRGQTEDEARAAIESKRLVVGEVTRRMAPEPEGVVSEMSPAPLTPLKPGDKVNLVISLGPRKVPPILGLTLDEAKRRLADLGLVVSTPIYQPDPVKARDTVLAADPPPGTVVSAGQRVILTLAEGPVKNEKKSFNRTFKLPGEAGKFFHYRVTVVDTVDGVPTESQPAVDERRAGQTQVTIEGNFYGQAYLRIQRDGTEVEKIQLP